MIDWLALRKAGIGLKGSKALPRQVRSDEEHLLAALTWIENAWHRTSQRGISKGYDLVRGVWAPAYPETTGYTIPTLFNLANYLQRPSPAKLGISLADYLLEASNGNGAVVHWQAGERAEAVVFDTGQVMFGMLAAFRYTEEQRYLDAAIRAGDWLVSIQSDGGSWKKNQHLGVEKVIDTRVAWALLELGTLTGQLAYRSAAVKNLDWACTMQDTDGWFRRCSFIEANDPFTHTLAYTAEGLYECGTVLADERYQKAGQKLADALLQRQRPDGSLAGTFGPEWSRPAVWSCLTGNVQMSRMWLLLHRDSGEVSYYTAARAALDFVKRCQDLETAHPGVRGGISGSFPIYGAYERFKYPNWAAKFFIDAVLAFALADQRLASLPFAG